MTKLVLEVHDHKTLSLDVPDTNFVGERLSKGGLAKYEPENVATWCALCDISEGTVYDIGANIGLFSYLAAVKQQEVVCCEPTPSLVELINAHCESNGFEVDVHAVALGEAGGTAELVISDVSDCSNTLNSDFRNGETITVPLMTLDSIVKEKAGSIGVMKIDTETTEPAVLRGGLESISRDRPWIICEVLAESQANEIAAFFEKVGGYEYREIGESLNYNLKKSIVGNGDHRFANWLFVPSEKSGMVGLLSEKSKEYIHAFQNGKPGLKFCLKQPPSFSAKGLLSRAMHWNLPETSVVDDSRVEWEFSLGTKNCKVANNGKQNSYASPPSKGASWLIESERAYTVTTKIKRSKNVGIRIEILQYDEKSLLHQEHQYLDNGPNWISFTSQPGAKHVRFIFRITGEGCLEIDNLEAYYGC